MSDWAGFPDVEQVAITVLTDLVTADEVNPGTVTPPDLQSHLPFLRVTVHGGSDSRITDAPILDVDAFDATRDGAWTLAERARQRLITAPNPTPDGLIDRARTLTRPQQVPWGDPNLFRVTATYRLELRRNTTP